MKVALVIASNMWFSPYVNIYTNLLDKRGINYDVVSWNRDGTKEDKTIVFDYPVKTSASKVNKIYLLFSYVSFVKKTLTAGKYDRLIVFTPQIAIFLSSFLKKHYKNRYIFDFRDLSIEQNLFMKPFFKKVLKYSYANVISSPGFKRFLPKEFDYIISHNFNVDEVKNTIITSLPEKENKDKSVVLTIGGIRDYSSNVEVLKALANKPDMKLQFVGKGYAAPLLQEFVDNNAINNVTFEGYYPKEKEREYIIQSSFLNIFYPRKASHDTALSNRFYNSLIYRKPMIVTHDTIQGDYCEKFELGLSLVDCTNLDVKIRNWSVQHDYKDFCSRCNTLLNDFLIDYEKFKSMFNGFLTTEK